MLRLIHASKVSYENVVAYYNSYTNKRELNSFTIPLIVENKSRYFERVMYSYENLYYLVDDTNVNYIIGHGSIGDSCFVNYRLPDFNHGHIAYAVRSIERRKGFGTLILNLLLEKCQELGMGEVCVSCHENNIGSKRVIEKNGGIFDKKWVDDWTGREALKYWIKLRPKLRNRLVRRKRFWEERFSNNIK